LKAYAYVCKTVHVVVGWATLHSLRKDGCLL